MKRIILISFIMLMSISAISQNFYGKTKHKPIKKMTRKEVKKAQIGHDLYVRVNGEMVRNRSVQWSTIKKPTYAIKEKERTVERIEKEIEQRRKLAEREDRKRRREYERATRR